MELLKKIISFFYNLFLILVFILFLPLIIYIMYSEYKEEQDFIDYEKGEGKYNLK